MLFRRTSTLSIDFFLYGLIIWALVIALSLGFWLQMYQTELEKKESQLAADSKRVESVLSGAFESAAQYTEFLGTKISQHKNPRDLAYIASLIVSRQQERSLDRNFYFSTTFDWVTPDKMLRVSNKTGILSPPFDMSSREYLHEAEKAPWRLQIGAPRVGGLSRRWIVPAGMGITNSKGELLGSVTMGFAIASLSQKLDQIKGKTDIHYFILTRDYKPVMYSVGENATRDMAGGVAEKTSSAEEVAAMPKLIGSKSGYLKEDVKYQDSRFSYALDMEPYPFIILAGYEANMKSALFNKIVLSRMLELSLIGGGAILMLYLMRRRLIRPILQLSRQADALSHGRPFNWPKSNILEIDRLGKELGKVAAYIDKEHNLRRQLEHSNREALEACEVAVRANQAKSDFLANMSHELRTPMNAVLGLTNILLMKDTAPHKQKELLSTIQTSAQHLMQLINDLLDVSKLESNKIQLEHTAFDLHDVMLRVQSINAVRAQEKGIRLHMKEPSSKPQRVMGDPLRLEQILMNIVGNAVKFTEKGSVTILLECKEHNASRVLDVAISVIDTGIGISQAKRETIFNKFIQADSSTTRKYGGSGLGLWICRSLVEAMHGKLWVEEAPGGGSRFNVEFSFPIATALSEPMLPLPERSGDAAPSPMHLLLAEDHGDNVLVITSFLDKMGHTYELAGNGQEAIDTLEKGKFDAVLMDIQMPEMDGLNATIRIRRREKETKRAYVPIIGITAYALPGDRERCIAAGMDNYIAKPFEPEKLAALLKLYGNRYGSGDLEVA